MISIIMPFKNEALFLEDSIHSILNQDESHFELIMVDDHSEDTSYSIAQSMQSKDGRIKLYRNPGNGIIDALKFAEKNTKGQYITRQDADDLMPKNKLSILKSILLKDKNVQVATGRVKYFSKTCLQSGFKKYEDWINSLCINDTHYQHIFKECVLVSSNWMMSYNDFKVINGLNDSIYPEDYHFVFKLYENNFRIKSSKEITHLWRDHPERASRNLDQYKDQKFFHLKVSFFKKFYKEKTIALWGAGKTGKKLAKVLISENIEFCWVTNNEKKINKSIYGVIISPIESLLTLNDPYIIISVTQRGAMESIHKYLQTQKLTNFFEF